MYLWQCIQCNEFFRNCFPGAASIKVDLCMPCYVGNQILEKKQREFDQANCIHIYVVFKDDAFKFEFKCKECGHSITYYKWSWQEEKNDR